VKIISSYVTTIVLLGLYATVMAIATFVEKAHGTMFVKTVIYYSPLFILLQFLLALNFVMVVIRRRFLKSGRWGMLLLHFAFVVILLGAFITHIFGKEGILHMRHGETGNQILIQTKQGTGTLTLPFHVELVKFTLTRYPGSMSPSSYESELLVHIDGKVRHELVYMNNVLDVKGYRFFQASYDADEEGTVLSVNRDTAGRNVTYAGYFLLLVGGIWCVFGKKGRIRVLYRELNGIAASSSNSS